MDNDKNNGVLTEIAILILYKIPENVYIFCAFLLFLIKIKLRSTHF